MNERRKEERRVDTDSCIGWFGDASGQKCMYCGRGRAAHTHYQRRTAGSDRRLADCGLTEGAR